MVTKYGKEKGRMGEQSDSVPGKAESGLSRKDFLKLGTAVAVSVGLGDALTRVTRLGDGVVAFAGSQGSIVVDTTKCAGCMSCMLACSLGHYGREDLSLSNIQISEDSFGAYPDDIEAKVKGRCDLCADTPYWNEEGGPNGKHACEQVCQMRAIQYVPV
jgi:ferredoxin